MTLGPESRKEVLGVSSLLSLARRFGQGPRLRATVACVLLASAPAWSDWPPANYSVEIVMLSGGSPRRTQKVYVSSGKRRLDHTPTQGETTTIIDRPDKGVSWTLTPGPKNCLEVPYQKKQGESHDLQDIPTSKYPREKVGFESKDGVPCIKYKVRAGTNTYYLWTNKKNQAPVHLEDSGKVLQIQWRNLKLSDPPKRIFEIPPGYKVTKLPL